MSFVVTFRNKKLSTRPNNNDDCAVSTNLAYDDVKLKNTPKGELYEEPNRVVLSDQGHYELTEHPVTTNSPPMYDTVESRRISGK